MRKTIDKESKRLASRTFELRRRRLNWTFSAKPKISDTCSMFIEQLKESKYPFRLFCKQGSTMENYQTVQLTSCSNLIGVIERKTEVTEQCEIKKSIKHYDESGACLVFSQSANGAISVMMYPYKSELHSRTEKNIVLYHSLHPDDITEKLILSCVKTFLMYIRCTSIYGLGCKPSVIESSKLAWLTIKDIRHKSKLLDSVVKMNNEWGKLVVAAAFAFLVGYVSKT
ncbi:hypothetical protein [Shewanella sp. GXUN23E]|uniref:hypothetical protein n=1 Tax=Shewanella sp. GXUN23E TaxID=3422498 RepID=UPI003D7EED36